MKNIIIKISIFIIIFICGILIWINQENNNIPKSAPSVSIIYNNNKIETVSTLYTWFDKEIGGNSNIGQEPEEGVKKINSTTVLPNSEISFRFDTKITPKSIIINHWKDNIIVDKKTYSQNDKNILSSPNVKEFYVYEIIGIWDETHSSAYAFKVEVK